MMEGALYASQRACFQAVSLRHWFMVGN